MAQTLLRVCLVHNSMAFDNQQGLCACLNVISIFHGKGPFGHGIGLTDGIMFIGGLDWVIGLHSEVKPMIKTSNS